MADRLPVVAADPASGAAGSDATSARPDFSAPEYFNNRETSFIEFNSRVLALAHDPDVPLLERLRYLCICSNNLDEFFEIRVAGLQQRLRNDGGPTGPDNLSPAEQLQRIGVKVQQHKQQYKLLNQELLPTLEDNRICFLSPEHWSDKAAQWARDFFDDEMLPILSPQGLDPAHPFPLLTNKSLNFVVSLEGKDAFGRDTSLAVVRAPRSLHRIIPVPIDEPGYDHVFVLLSTMIQHNMGRLFPGLKTTGVYQFRVTRNSDLYLDDDEASDLRVALQDELGGRNFGQAVRLEVGNDCPADIVDFLLREFELGSRDLYLCNGPVNLNRLQNLPDLIDRPDLKFKHFISRTPTGMRAGEDLFAAIRRRDCLLHYPYESSGPVVNLLRAAARDDDVLAIKQTLYRTGTESVYVDALIEAAANGKDVTVVIELRARFDEEANIELSTRLQQEGVQVVYGVVGFKTHSKLMLIVRREAGKLVRYGHIATGNYHTRTARAYTDLGLLTFNRQITGDIQKIFNQLSGLGKVANLKKALHAPFTMHDRMIDMIERQARLAGNGKPCGIKARMNSLTEPALISALYRASCAGVPIRLLVRGICALRPGLKSVSENITVVSVLGRFLEHSRVFAFGPDGEEDVYISSADWMSRNMFHRVEVAVPILDDELRRRVVRESLDYYFSDNRFCWQLNAEGKYKRRKVDGESFSAQMTLLEKLNRSKT
jgi:polyphosphate kinase